jgi:methionyl-tRNA formyltransferase
MVDKKINIDYVFIEKEFEHELEQHAEKITNICKRLNIQHTLDLSIVNQIDVLRRYNVDFIIVYGYRRLINKNVYERAKYGTVAMHYALLPKYRGFAPLNWALINGEQHTGVSLFFLANEMDDGDIVEQKVVYIKMEDDINTLHEKCNRVAIEIFGRQFDLFEEGIINRMPQNSIDASYTCARSPEDGLIHWEYDTRTVYNLIRALTYPFPCAFTYLNGEIIYILNAEICENKNYVGRIPGKIVSIRPGKGIVVLTGDGLLFIKNIIDSHGNRTTADKVIKSVRVKLG